MNPEYWFSSLLALPRLKNTVFPTILIIMVGKTNGFIAFSREMQTLNMPPTFNRVIFIKTIENADHKYLNKQKICFFYFSCLTFQKPMTSFGHSSK